jgi:hypothetical protein
MKKYVIFLVGMVLSVMVFGQNGTKMVGVKEVEVIPPKFTGTENVKATVEEDNSLSLRNYLLKNVNYPEGGSVWLSEGTEVVKFTVTPSGNVSDFKIVNSVSPDIDKELIRVLKTTNGMWNPGYNNGALTAMEQEVSAVFGNNSDGKILTHFVNNATICFKLGSNALIFKQNPEKALRQFNQGIRYLPNDQALLLMRGMCYYNLGDKEKAKKDWDRLASLGGIDSNSINYDLTGINGYSEMMDILAKNK